MAGWVNSWRQARANYPANKRNAPNDDHANKNSQGSFNRFYGASTREYAARYDRIYISLPNNNENGTPANSGDRNHGNTVPSERSSLQDVSVDSFELIANKPIGRSRTHFLSDHFGIACKLRFISSANNS